jgi:hypothetical protein
MNKLIGDYDKATRALVVEFAKRMVAPEELEEMDFDDNFTETYGAGPIGIADQYFGVNEIWQCIKFNISAEIMSSWADYQLDSYYDDKLSKLNLYHYWRAKTLSPEILKAERKAELERSKASLEMSAGYFAEQLGIAKSELLKFFNESKNEDN